MSNQDRNKLRLQWVILLGTLAAVGALVFVMFVTEFRRIYGNTSTRKRLDAACTALGQSGLNVDCYHNRGTSTLGVQVIDPSSRWGLSGALAGYDGEPLEGLDCTDRRRKIVLQFWHDPDKPIAGEAAVAVRKLCSVLAKQ